MTLLLGLIGAPHLARLPEPVLAFVLAMLALRLLLTVAQRRAPPVWVIGVLGVSGLALVVSSFGTLLGREPGVALLTTMTAMKLLELRTQRDVIMLSFLGYFLAVTHFLFDQSGGITLAMAVGAVALTATLVHVHQGRSHGARLPAMTAMRLIVQALPIMLVLYVVFPRTGPLWQMGVDLDHGYTGLSETLRPGDIAELAQSSATAFTVRFEGPLPAAEDRYFRGPVFDRYDGRSWHALEPAFEPRQPGNPRGEERVQEIVMQASGQRYLYAMDTVTRVPAGTQLSVDGQIILSQPLREQRVYQSASRITDRTAGPAPTDISVPPLSSRVRRLAQSLRGASPRQTTDAVLNYFRNGAFVYTLKPGLGGKDPVDHFLFESQRGFCQHYASSFVLLLRTAGVPARVVGGYQGGQWNPVAGVLKVRQADAHAWAEVWLPEGGWLRVDPTSVVEPERVQSALSISGSGDGARIGFNLDLGALQALWQRAGWMADGLRYHWRVWVVDFDRDRQQALWDSLGLSALPRQWMLLAGVALILTLLAIGTWAASRPRRAEPLLRLWLRFERLAAADGLRPEPGEGRAQFLARYAAAHPNRLGQISRFGELFVSARYHQGVAMEELRDALAGLEKPERQNNSIT